VVGCSVEGFDK